MANTLKYRPTEGIALYLGTRLNLLWPEGSSTPRVLGHWDSDIQRAIDRMQTSSDISFQSEMHAVAQQIQDRMQRAA